MSENDACLVHIHRLVWDRSVPARKGGAAMSSSSGARPHGSGDEVWRGACTGSTGAHHKLSCPFRLFLYSASRVPGCPHLGQVELLPISRRGQEVSKRHCLGGALLHVAMEHAALGHHHLPKPCRRVCQRGREAACTSQRPGGTPCLDLGLPCHALEVARALLARPEPHCWPVQGST